jgi:polyphenol oxidase
MSLPSDWIIPDWPAPKNLRALITTKAGGVSTGAYASMNLGDHVGDDAQLVKQNRAALKKYLPAEPCWLRQVHGTSVLSLEKYSEPVEADASVTQESNVICAIMTADCLPVLLCDESGITVGAAHAGWRGLCNGVIEKTVAAMQCKPANLMAYLGPAIGPKKFEVGSEVREAFMRHDIQADKAFSKIAGNKFLADIYELARQRLRQASVTRIYGGEFCTFDDERFFSFRRDKITGRMASLIWLENSLSKY